jgi:hypothetical protein
VACQTGGALGASAVKTFGIKTSNTKDAKFMDQWSVKDKNGKSTANTVNSRYEKTGSCSAGRPF